MPPPGAGWWPPWPVIPSVDVARTALSSWAKRQWLVPNDLFDGLLRLSDGSVVRMEVTRRLETRVESPDTKPGKLTESNYYDRLSSHRLDRDEWQPYRWHGVRRASVETAQCGTCHGLARIRCSRRRGHSVIWCRRTVRCKACRGVGRIETLSGPREGETCPACKGRKVLTCPECKGKGRRPCTSSFCVDGRQRCPKCSGHGILTTYVAGEIRRRIDRTVIDAGPGNAAVKAAGSDQYRMAGPPERRTSSGRRFGSTRQARTGCAGRPGSLGSRAAR